MENDEKQLIEEYKSVQPIMKKDIYTLISGCSDVIKDAVAKADSIINDDKYKKILVSVSGGSDSDDILDICWNVDRSNKCMYIWFDTGLEYKATKRHLDYLEKKYGIEIVREKPIVPIPKSCKDFGQPFASKFVSDHICSLQGKGFQFTDEPYEELNEKYVRAKDSLKWWCNSRGLPNKESWYGISRNRYLKEFLISNPPNFKISSKCCKYAKKKVSSDAIEKYGVDLKVTGLRSSEGGIRSLNQNFNTCFTKEKKCDSFRPIWWWRDEDKAQYEKCMEIKHSDCYEVWGFKRTGCVGCPFDPNIFEHLEIVKQYEPLLYKAANNIFKDSYEYTKKYKAFIKDMKQKGIEPRKDWSGRDK